jgi:hypothetical protein
VGASTLGKKQKQTKEGFERDAAEGAEDVHCSLRSGVSSLFVVHRDDVTC